MIRSVLGTVTVHTRVGPGQGVAAGELGVQAAGLVGVLALLGAGLAAELLVHPLGQVGGPLGVAGLPVGLGLGDDREGDDERAPLTGLARGEDRRQGAHRHAAGRAA